MTETEVDDATAAALPASAATWRHAWLPLALAILAFVQLGRDLAGEKHFVDEAAYYSQAYYAPLFASGRWNDRLWLDYPAYDLPPLPKYLIGASLGLTGRPMPTPADARAWYGNTSLRFDPPGALVAARWPIVMCGVIGCLAVFGIGRRVGGPWQGAVASLLLMVNPLYRMLARRAMSDVPCEMFVVLGLLLGLAAWTRWLDGKRVPGVVVGLSLAGACGGLALLCKMSGLLALMVLAVWGVLGLVLLRKVSSLGVVLAGGVAAAVAGFVVFVVLDPYMTAQPTGPLPPAIAAIAKSGLVDRARKMANLRVEVAAGQQEMFSHNALRSPWDKLSTTFVQGFGRFGPLGPAESDSTRRYDREQDLGAAIWLPLVLVGLALTMREGFRQRARGVAPTAWAVLAYALVAGCVVSAYLPLAWDRYFLALQVPAALLASSAIAAGVRWVARAGSPDAGA